jgi:hypothetical protein
MRWPLPVLAMAIAAAPCGAQAMGDEAVWVNARVSSRLTDRLIYFA